MGIGWLQDTHNALCLMHEPHTKSLRPLRIFFFYIEVRNITFGWQKTHLKIPKRRRRQILRMQWTWQRQAHKFSQLCQMQSLHFRICNDWQCHALALSQQAWIHAVSFSWNVGFLLTLALLLFTWISMVRKPRRTWEDGDHRNACSTKWEPGLTNLKPLIRD